MDRFNFKDARDIWEAAAGIGISKEELEVRTGDGRISNFHLIESDAFETIPKLIEENPHLRIAFLHLDMDVYEPTKICLDALFSPMSRNGLVVFDVCNAVEGATRAADEVSADPGCTLEKLPFCNVPSFFQVA